MQSETFKTKSLLYKRTTIWTDFDSLINQGKKKKKKHGYKTMVTKLFAQIYASLIQIAS